MQTSTSEVVLWSFPIEVPYFRGRGSYSSPNERSKKEPFYLQLTMQANVQSAGWYVLHCEVLEGRTFPHYIHYHEEVSRYL